MKHLIFIVAMVSSQLAFANGNVTGKIVELKAHAIKYQNGNNHWNNRIWITIEGVTQK